MTISAIRSVRAWLQIPAATVLALFLTATIARGAPIQAGAITFVGTDSNIYYCDTKCAEPKCITCKAAAIHVRRDDQREAAIVPIADSDSDAGPPASATEYGWPTFSPDGQRI